MKTEIQKLLTFQKFFKNVQTCRNRTTVDLEKPSKILVQNIYHSWLRSIHGKTNQHFPVYLDKAIADKYAKTYYGIINQQSCDVNQIVYEEKEDECDVHNKVHLKFDLMIPQSDVMQYFIQWQRYRKYWWSSVTTTPSLFSINDMKHEVGRSDVNIIANFKWGQQVVEAVSVNSNGSDASPESMAKNTSCLTCTMGLETAFVTILLDGLSNATKEEYLRLHNKMAPYKISFALDSEEPKVLNTLKELAQLLFHKLKSKEISAWLPSFTLPIQEQVKENLHLGVTYTAILNENTLSNGIFYLLNSSTMLKEQIHVADFDSYASLLCKK
ncbi:DNA polymerase subunit gamma-2, mitochondrial isoform X2 [Vanessa cardui]|uniref:DNA polymerase subunit gamma-2, mitochondrial isoform X2 n=1 Tax=Vanessa cardui TaxID=171605 RepID=UPI001F12D21D|nr:DNA polymerase subunit gamma-2, mitochondrial isoform X2 [Vanessa cardui]